MTLSTQATEAVQPPSSPLLIDFFHDAVCGWCYVTSPRLRKVAGELGIQVRHHTFVLQDSREQMVQVFGSMEAAKTEILKHWQSCALHDDSHSINIEGMREQPFEYPHGLLSALACQAAQDLAGEQGHWDYFDAVQRAHLAQNRNIGDTEVLLAIAIEQGFERSAFLAAMNSASARQAVQVDRIAAASSGIRSIPTLIVSSATDGREVERLQTMSAEQLKSRLLALM